MKKKRFFIIDGAGFYYRAFYGIRANLRTADGIPTNAVYGFAKMFLKIVREEKPDYFAIALDSKEKTFRHEMYPQYKANRQKMPEDLRVQIPIIEKMIDTFHIPAFKRAGYEADDLIGTAAVRGVEAGLDVTVVSGDKDLMQLVGEGIAMLDPMKEKKYEEKDVKEKFGVEPARVVDMLGLMGDASDNIPGVPGVGEKTARKLLEEYGDIDNLLRNADRVKKPKLRESLIKYADQARLSRELATIKTDVELETDFEKLKLSEPDREKANRLFLELGFKSLIGESESEEQERGNYTAVLDEAGFAALMERLSKASAIAVDTETTSVEPMRARLVGISLSLESGEGFYIPLSHDYEGAPAQLEKKKVIQALKPVLENGKIKKYGHNLKYDLLVLRKEGIRINPVSFDTMIASYLLYADERRHNLTALAKRELGYSMIGYSDVAGKGAKEIPFGMVPVEQATDYAAEDADISLRLTELLEKKIVDNGFDKLYYRLELPVVEILAEMEQNGIAIDANKLERYSHELEEQLSRLEKEIYAAAGEEFNIGSPKQLAEILFEKLGLRKVKKTKTGSSTDQQVLETLASAHPLPKLVLRYRTLSKLKSTYVDPLPKMVIAETGRIHTSFNQAMAATGRLSSSSPNLQNIPIRTDEGRKIREAFHAEKGFLLVSADYSQVELRLLAHLSGDAVLTEAFGADEDIHARTAREIFGAMAEHSSDMRRIAKAINFSIIYGKTAFGLARDIGITRAEASEYINNYFARYSGVRDFIESVKTSAREKGYVTTMAGRRRDMPNIKSANRTLREMTERMAVNSVVQGSAADLMKQAMIDVDSALKHSGARLLLQVHDELIVEAPKAETESVSAKIRRAMENAQKLSVPLKVQVSAGSNWGELH